MAYTTRLTDTLTVTSKDVRLTTKLVEREHTIHGLPGRVVIYQNRTTGKCTLYQGPTAVATFGTLTKAYDAVRGL